MINDSGVSMRCDQECARLIGVYGGRSCWTGVTSSGTTR
jgi:hypothetical protein